MPEIIFLAQNLTKRYRKFNFFHECNALDDFNMEIKHGDIYGFVGKNGAGKTTLMRILTGRLKQTDGKINLYGNSEAKELCVQRGRIGAMIETPALYHGMTARDNMEVLRLQRGMADQKSILEVLKLVGLEDVKSKKVKDFSLGMRQRLGLAMALLGNREFLVLDEPMNGLDPEGIVEFRELLKMLNTEHGITILMSSHLLSELNQLATSYGFIHNGKMVEQISEKKLRERCKSYLDICVDDVHKAKALLYEVCPNYEIDIISNNKIHIYDFSGDTGSIAKVLVTGNVNVKEMTVCSASLEGYYMSVIKEGNL